MKIIRIKTAKSENKKDMFVVLCLLQTVFLILTVFLIFAVSRINADLFYGMKEDIRKLFVEDKDPGGYYTVQYDSCASEEAVNLSFSENKPHIDNDGIEKATLLSVSCKSNEAFDIYSADKVMPVNGRISSDYGYRIHPIYNTESFHHGRDIAAPEGTPVYAVYDGMVTEAGQGTMAGNYIKIDHKNGYCTLYCHCSELYVKEGINVRKGDVIASVGETGLATGPHLHFELHENGSCVDPAIFLDGASDVD